MTPRRRWTTALLAVLAATTLAGCSLERVGAAAVVDGEQISTDRLQALTQEYLDAVPGADAGHAQRVILEGLVTERVYEEAADQLGVELTDGQVAAEVRSLEQFVRDNQLCQPDQTIEKCLPPLLASRNEPGVPPSRIDDWVRSRLMFDRLLREVNDLSASEPGTQEMAERTTRRLRRIAARMDIEVNPRFGRWAGDSVIVPVPSGGLAEDLTRQGQES